MSPVGESFEVERSMLEVRDGAGQPGPREESE